MVQEERFLRDEVLLDLGLLGVRSAVVIHEVVEAGGEALRTVHAVYVQVATRLLNVITLVTEEGFEAIGEVLGAGEGEVDEPEELPEPAIFPSTPFTPDRLLRELGMVDLEEPGHDPLA